MSSRLSEGVFLPFRSRIICGALSVMLLWPTIPVTPQETRAKDTMSTPAILAQAFDDLHSEDDSYVIVFPVQLESPDASAKAPLVRKWQVRDSSIRTQHADLDSDGKMEVYFAFEAAGRLPPGESRWRARWLCIRGFESTGKMRVPRVWKPLPIRGRERAHFADRIDRFEVIDLGALKALAVQHSFTDFQVLPRRYETYLELYGIQGPDLVRIFSKKIGERQSGGAISARASKWIKQIEIESTEESATKAIRLEPADHFVLLDGQWEKTRQPVHEPSEKATEIYEWSAEQFLFVRKE